MSVFNKSWLLACAGLAALSFASASHAQQAASAAANPQTQDQGGPGSEVVVTATRRAETTQKVGGGVTALTGADLSKGHVADLTDFASLVPGLSFQANSPTNNLVAIRGVASSTAELGSAVGVYLDDVPIGSSTQFGLGSQAFNFGTFDLDRVEVLNGPQGTLYGANALGGAIKYVTAPPRLGMYDAQVEAEGSYTEHGSYNDGLRGMVNIPMFGDNAALRIDAIQRYDSGYADDPTHGRTNQGAGTWLGGRISFLAQLTPDLDVRLTYFGQKIKANGVNAGFYNLATSTPQAGPYDQDFAIEQPQRNAVSVFSGVVNWDLHWAKLTSVTAYQDSYGYYQNDVSPFYEVLLPLYTGDFATALSPYDLYVNDNTYKFSQELRLASPDSRPLQWSAGGYYTHETTHELVDLLYSANPSGTLPAPFSSMPFYGYLPSSYEEFAGFGDVTWFFNRWFDLTGGVRYSHQDQTYQSNIWWIGFGPPFGKVYPYSATSSQGVATWLVNPRFHITPDIMLYGKVSSGFRPGGPNFVLPPAFNSPAPSTFQPDTLWNYEVGEKASFLDHRAILDVDAYDIEWRNIQTTDNVNGINQLVNAGNARVRGVEAQGSFRVVPALTIGGSAAYTDARLTTPAPVLDVLYTGARLPLSPRYNFALTGTYNYEISPDYRGYVQVTDAWVGDRTSGYAGSATNVLYKLPAYNTVNLDAALQLKDGLEIDLYLKNVFDTKGQLSANTLNNVFFPTAGVPVMMSLPRTVGTVLKYRFAQ